MEEVIDLPWRTFCEQDETPDPVPTEELRRLGFDRSTSLEEARKLLREHFGELPDEVVDADGPRLRETIEAAAAQPDGLPVHPLEARAVRRDRDPR
jgi:hypothetical protein